MRFLAALAFILSAVLCLSADMDIIVAYDAFAGDVTTIIQYMKDGKTEYIRGHLKSPSKDNNIRIAERFSGDSQQFSIENTSGIQAQVWVANHFADEDFFDESMLSVLQEAKVTVVINDHKNKVSHRVEVPEEPGMIFLAGTVSDGAFHPSPRMYPKLKCFYLSVVDAKTGNPLADVQAEIRFRGNLVSTGNTDSQGELAIQLSDYGDYTIKIFKEGYIPVEHSFFLDLNEIPTLLRVPLSEELKEYRIVLTWGAFPRDLDAHLAGPMPGGGTFHIWWQNKVLVGGRNFLDRDDTNRYGPETITIYVPADGLYQYAVHNFSQRHASVSTGLPGSQARVDVYANGKLEHSFNPDPSQKGTVWHVFNITEDKEIVPVNRYSHQSDSKNIFK
jgi:hypothetical protein